MKEHATNKEDVTHDSHRRIDGQHYLPTYFTHIDVLDMTINAGSFIEIDNK